MSSGARSSSAGPRAIGATWTTIPACSAASTGTDVVVVEPTLELERSIHGEGIRFVIGCDEVGRGAIAGPVAVGLCVIDVTVGPMPVGLRDSKLLAEKRREELAPLAAAWALHSAVG